MRNVKRVILGLAVAGILLAGCGGGNDTLAKVVGPNPISDVHAAIDRANDHGWTDTRRAAFAQQLVAKYPGLTTTQAACLTVYYTDTYSYQQLTDPNKYPTASEEAQSEAAITRCLV